MPAHLQQVSRQASQRGLRRSLCCLLLAPPAWWHCGVACRQGRQRLLRVSGEDMGGGGGSSGGGRPCVARSSGLAP